jgi:hypothetical protein
MLLFAGEGFHAVQKVTDQATPVNKSVTDVSDMETPVEKLVKLYVAIK